MGRDGAACTRTRRLTGSFHASRLTPILKTAATRRKTGQTAERFAWHFRVMDGMIAADPDLR